MDELQGAYNSIQRFRVGQKLVCEIFGLETVLQSFFQKCFLAATKHILWRSSSSMDFFKYNKK